MITLNEIMGKQNVKTVMNDLYKKSYSKRAFIEFQKNGFSNTSEDYFNLSDCIFNYNDSGDLFIYLNKAKYNGDQVYKKIYDLLFK